MHADLKELLEDMVAKDIISGDAYQQICDFYQEIVVGSLGLPPVLMEAIKGAKKGQHFNLRLQDGCKINDIKKIDIVHNDWAICHQCDGDSDKKKYETTVKLSSIIECGRGSRKN